MKTLFWKSNKETKNLIPKQFESEMAFEKYLFQNQELLGDIVILKRQIHTGSRQGILDMLGVDQEGNICIIEMKNEQVSEDVILQVLGYAMWAENNPDSIRALWLESTNKPEGIKINWNSIKVRIIVVAPSYRAKALKKKSKIVYPFDLVQIQRYSFENDEFILVETLEEEATRKHKITKASTIRTWGDYEDDHGAAKTNEFKGFVKELNNFGSEKDWNLPYNLTKNYTGFKYGNRLVYFVEWSGVSSWFLGIKVSKEVAEKFLGEHWVYQRYDNGFSFGIFRTKSGKFESIDEVKNLLENAYKRISGID